MKEWQQEIHTAYCSWDGKPWLTASKFYRANNALFVSVDLIGEKNQVILELYLFHYRSTSAGHQVQVALAAQDTMPAIESSGGTLPFTPPEVAGQVQVTSSQNGTAAVQVIPIENGDAAVKEEMVQSMDNSIARYGIVVKLLHSKGNMPKTL